MENIIIGVVFIGAIAYLGKQLASHFSPKSTGCAKGCGGACGQINFEIPEQEKIANKKL